MSRLLRGDENLFESLRNKKTLFRESFIFWGGSVLLGRVKRVSVFCYRVFNSLQKHFALCSLARFSPTVLIHRPKRTLKKTYLRRSFLRFWGGRIRTSEMPGPKPGALPLGDAPIRLSVFRLLYIIKSIHKSQEIF